MRKGKASGWRTIGLGKVDKYQRAPCDCFGKNMWLSLVCPELDERWGDSWGAGEILNPGLTIGWLQQRLQLLGFTCGLESYCHVWSESLSVYSVCLVSILVILLLVEINPFREGSNSRSLLLNDCQQCQLHCEISLMLSLFHGEDHWVRECHLTEYTVLLNRHTVLCIWTEYPGPMLLLLW